MRIKLDEGAFMPTRAYPSDAGLDLYAREMKVIPARGSAKFDTGVHIELPLVTIGDKAFYTVGMLKSKSGLNVKHGITSEGVIDYSYRGSIVAKLYNNTDEDYVVERGHKITQLVILPILNECCMVFDELTEGARGNNGFGSSGV